MTDIVQIICPHCQNNLRIPAAWVSQTLRCKYCRQVLQAKQKSPAAASARQKPSNDGDTKPMQLPGPPMPGPVASRGFRLKPGSVAALLIVGAGVAALVIGIVLGPALRKMFHTAAARGHAVATNKIAADAGVMPVKNPPPEAVKELPQAKVAPRDPDPKAANPNRGTAPAETTKAPPDRAKKPPVKVPPEEGKELEVPPALHLMLNELALFPPITGGKKAPPIDPATLPEISENVLTIYKADYKSVAEFRQFKDKEAEFPLRAAVVKTALALRANVNNTNMRATVPGKFKDKQLQVLKNQVKAEQNAVAQRTLILKDLLRDLVEIGAKNRDRESKRWQVLFDYALLQLKARVVHVVEYNFNLAQIRTDSLPALTGDEKLYRLTPQAKVTANEAYIKQYVKDLKKGWTALAQNHPGTPWAALAPREQAVLLGLSWQPAKQ